MIRQLLSSSTLEQIANLFYNNGNVKSNLESYKPEEELVEVLIVKDYYNILI